MQFFDRQILLLIAHWRNPGLTWLMKLLTDFGGTKSLILITVLLTVILVWRHYRQEAVILVTAMLSSVVINQTLKHLINRVRPDVVTHLIVATSPSFPSGHAMNNTIFYFIITYLSWWIWRKKPLTLFVALVGLVLVMLISFSRLYLGVHYPTDIIAGWILGLAVGESVIFFARKFDRKDQD